MGRIAGEIEGKQRAARAAGSVSQAESLEEAKYFRDEWRAGRMDGLKAMENIFALDIKADDRTKIISEMLAGKDGEYTLAAQAYERWEQYRAAGLAEIKKGGTKETPEAMAYKAHTEEILKHLGQMRFTGEIAPDNLLKHVEGIIRTEETDLLTKAGGLRNLAQARSMSLGGAFDYMSYNQYDENMKAHPVMIGRSEELFSQLNAAETQNVMDALKANDWHIKTPEGEQPQGFFEESEKGNRTGQVHFNLENGKGETATVRVGHDGNLQKKEAEDGRTRWVPFGKELEAGRNLTMAQFETRISDSSKAKINDAMDRAVTSTRGTSSDSVISNFRSLLSKELGNKAKTEEGKAYIEKMVEELRKRPGFVNWR